MSNHITKKDAENLFKDYNTLKDIEITNKLNSIKSSQVTSMQDYSEALVPLRILTTDTLNAAMGKLEYKANRGWHAEQELASLCKNCIRVPDYDNTKIEYTYGVPKIDVEPYGINGFTNKEVISGESYSFYLGFITAADSPVIMKIGLPHNIGKNTFTFENLTSVDDVPSPVGLCLTISSTVGYIKLRTPLSNIARVKHGIYTLSYEITSFDPYTVGGVIIDKIQLEEGSVATDFELNIEDAFVQLPEVASTALSEANRANTRIDNLKIGGVNRFKELETFWDGVTLSNDKKSLSFVAAETSYDCDFCIKLYDNVRIGDKFTFSCDVSGFASDDDFISLGIGLATETPYLVIKNGRCSITQTLRSTYSGMIFIGDSELNERSISAEATVTLSNFKVEKGDIATDYSPAPEDFLPLSGGTMTGNIRTKSIRPDVTNTEDVGSNFFRYNNGYFNYVSFTDCIMAEGNFIGTNYATSYNANVLSYRRIEENNTDYGLTTVMGDKVSIHTDKGVDIRGDLIPSYDNTYDIGQSGKTYKNVYATNLYQGGNEVLDTSDVANLTQQQIASLIAEVVS